MQRYDKQWSQAGDRVSSNGIPTLLAVNGIIVLVLIGLALSSPSASEWISAAAQAEFAGGVIAETPPTQIAQPDEVMRTARTN